MLANVITLKHLDDDKICPHWSLIKSHQPGRCTLRSAEMHAVALRKKAGRFSHVNVRVSLPEDDGGTKRKEQSDEGSVLVWAHVQSLVPG